MRIRGNKNRFSFEEARRQRLREYKKQFEDLGTPSHSKSVPEFTESVQKSAEHKLKMSHTRLDTVEVRRSSRPRSSFISYSEEFNIELSQLRKRPKPILWTSYLSRPVNEVKFASGDERAYAMRCAEKFQNNLQSGHPSFIKSMVRTHVYSCFWLGLPIEFCQDHLPSDDVTLVLVDKDGAEYNIIYKRNKRGLSGGWRGFALDHKLDDGDALVFELTEPKRFQIYIFKACELQAKEAAKD